MITLSLVNACISFTFGEVALRPEYPATFLLRTAFTGSPCWVGMTTACNVQGPTDSSAFRAYAIVT